MLPQAARNHYQAQQRLTAVTVAAARRSWGLMGAEFDDSWRLVGPRLTALLTAAQLAAATGGAAYIPRSLAETGEAAGAVAEVNPRAFAGYASDGRPLDSLLYGAVTSAKSGMSSGLSWQAALDRGGRWLEGAAWTQVSDASRSAAGAAIAARPKVTGYVRVLNAPSCGRCAVLAGRWYRWSSGFQRHPRCDCFHRPGAAQSGDLTDPQAYFEGLSRGEQDRLFGKAQSKAIRDGADVGQVVNAGRSTVTAGGRKFTTVGRGPARGVPRLTPDQIYIEAGSNRDEAIRLLIRFGYLRP